MELWNLDVDVFLKHNTAAHLQQHGSTGRGLWELLPGFKIPWQAPKLRRR